MTTLVLLTGQMRTADLCFASIKEHVLDRIGDYELIAHIAGDADAAKVRAFAPKRLVVADAPELPERNYIMRTGRGVFGIQQTLAQLWRLEEANKLKKQAESQRGARYDWVVRLRPDAQFFESIEDLNACDPTCIYLPPFGSAWGYNDRFAFGGSEQMDVYHDKFGGIDNCVAHGGIFHPESILKWFIDRANIPVRRTRALFDLVRNDGSRMRPTWNAPHGDVLPEWRARLLTSI